MFQPYTSNIYTRRTLSGEFIVVNKHLLKDLVQLGLWNDSIKNKLISANGSVQNIAEIPDNLKAIYKTIWEISQKTIIEMAADRGAYICQSQSLNIFMENANFAKLTSMHFHGWKLGLKTGMYYLRTKAAADAIKFTLDKSSMEQPDTQTVVTDTVKEIMTSTPVSTKTLVSATTPEVQLTEQRLAEIACSLDNPDSCEMCSG